ncbi:MAG: glycosyltransferase fused to TPR-repeat domain protein [Candidatus Scalindua rubra]|uniref:Glycosyltransferase fused to TPR-repeat domain protein n=1 Tax=Candidatus Scalindua rubra TaxID=1872076 RepID=A0A1E3X9Z3_9BACT|nr:MAG: glycosyltransferase fused to TPR-repeat domain protein [Candidatus Scalindua rubra]
MNCKKQYINNPKTEIPLKGGRGRQNPIQRHGQTPHFQIQGKKCGVHATQSRKGTLSQRDLTSAIPGPDRRADRTRAGQNPTLSLCMIVKDEEKLLPTCLESVKDYVDEIIIVDTGSTDKTVEVAKRYGAKIYHHQWENSFSKARNYSLKYATCDWILILDADEEIDKEDAHKLRDVIKDPVGCETTHRVGCETAHRVNAILIPVFSKYSNGKNTSVTNSERIFRNHLGFHFEGIVHNNLKYSGPTKNENIRLYHHGYNQDEEQMERKFTRTSTLLKEQIKNDPENPVPHHYLAISYLDRKKHDECIHEAIEAIRLYELRNSNAQRRLLTYYTASVAFFRKKDLTNAEKYALKAIDFYPDYVDAYCILSSIFFLQKRSDKCIEVTKKYLRLLKPIESDPSTALTIPYNTLQHARLAYSRMAIIYYEQGKEQEGSLALEDAVNSTDEKWEPYLVIGKYFMGQNNLKMAERFLIDGFKNDPKNKEIQYYLADTYEKSGASDKALTYFKKILDDHPDEIPAQYNLGLLLLKDSQFDKAIKSFKLVTEKDPRHIGALFNVAIAYERIGNIAQAKDIYNDILTIKPENPEVLVRLGTLYLNEPNYIKAEKCFLNTIKLDKYLLEAYLTLSKIYISLNDLESCVMSCDELLRYLNLPRNITINSVSDLSKLYINIGTSLIKQQKELLANTSFEIATLIDQCH